MTVQALAQRLARFTSSKTLSNMSAEDRLVMIDCINSAVYNWFVSAPENARMTTVSHMIRQSESGRVDTVEGENALVGLALQDYHLGCSIQIEGDTNMNEVVSVEGTPQVLNQHKATGNFAYQLYFDAIMITDYLVNRLVSHPRILETGVELYRDDKGMKFMGAERRAGGWWWDSAFTRRFGQPYRYVIENTGISLKDEARIMLRVDPIPEDVYTVTFDAVIDAPTMTLNDMDGTVNLAVPDQYVLPHLLPLALGDLATSPIWDGGDTATAIQKSQTMIAKIQSDLKSNRGAPHNYVRTRPGW
jgi:hypothetical protein